MRKIKSRSAPALDALFYAGESFDLIYSDADHRCDAVLADAALSLRILRPNGILIWDDYQLYDLWIGRARRSMPCWLCIRANSRSFTRGIK